MLLVGEAVRLKVRGNQMKMKMIHTGNGVEANKVFPEYAIALIQSICLLAENNAPFDLLFCHSLGVLDHGTKKRYRRFVK